MTTIDFITELFCRIDADAAMPDAKNHIQKHKSTKRLVQQTLDR